VNREPTDRDHWESQAENWVRWTRGPIADAYVDYAPQFFELLPAPHGPVLEVGCGEGRVIRDLRARGYEPTGVDVSPTMIHHAQEADPDGRYVVADASRLPFAEESFALVVAFNSLMDIDDLDGAVAEAARVLRPGGRLCACVTHPVADAGVFAERAAQAPFVIEGSYLGRQRFDAVVERGDTRMHFRGWANPIETYAAAFAAAGLLIERLREPAVPDERIAHDPAEERWRRIPAFLFITAVKHGGPGADEAPG
jgi:SAM-dependent methyltransferase